MPPRVDGSRQGKRLDLSIFSVIFLVNRIRFPA